MEKKSRKRQQRYFWNQAKNLTILLKVSLDSNNMKEIRIYLSYFPWFLQIVFFAMVLTPLP